MHLVRSGYSWSGNERNCVFLNYTTPSPTDQVIPRFAKAASITGLDHLDDGRAVAAIDWDHDGDVDLWFRNRSAPRLRLMRNLTNEVAPREQSVTIRLIGTTVNRDAIGARAELVCQSPGRHEFRVVRSVRAGDAFLSQSSKELHFGVSEGAKVDDLLVHWPDGTQEHFRGVDGGGRFEIKQGSGQAIALPARTAIALNAQPNLPLPPTAAARIILPGRVALPRLPMRFENQPQPTVCQLEQKPTLMTFWTSSCPNCCRELTDLAQHQQQVIDAGLEVIGVCLDGLESSDHPTIDELAEATEFLRSIRFPYRSAQAVRETTERVRHFQNALFSTYPEFVVPLSFLLDADGNVVAIYRGAFAHTTLIQDVELTRMTDETLRAQTTPFNGTWITRPATRSQFAEFIGGRLAAHEPNESLRYYQIAAESETDVAAKEARRTLVDAMQEALRQESGRPPASE